MNVTVLIMISNARHYDDHDEYQSQELFCLKQTVCNIYITRHKEFYEVSGIHSQQNKRE